jgi:hypothetical protein
MAFIAIQEIKALLEAMASTRHVVIMRDSSAAFSGRWRER